MSIGFLKIESEVDGPVDGLTQNAEAVRDGYTIEVQAMSHEVSHEYSPQHGYVSGDRKHAPFKIIKEIDSTTPTLHKACTNGDHLTNVQFVYYREDGDTQDRVKYFEWTLTDAYIVKIRPLTEELVSKEYGQQFMAELGTGADLFEEVEFSYQTITWTHHAHRGPNLQEHPQVEHQDGWTLAG
jgi:type VI secretion system secreted protein Hcp